MYVYLNIDLNYIIKRFIKLVFLNKVELNYNYIWFLLNWIVFLMIYIEMNNYFYYIGIYNKLFKI